MDFKCVLVLVLCIASSQAAFPANCWPDITFIFETSERLNDGTNLQNIIANVKNLLVPAYELDTAKTHTAIVHFSSPDLRSAVLNNLGTFTTSAAQLNQFDVLSRYIQSFLGVSDVATGFNYATSQVFTGAGGDRATSPNVVVLVAEGFWDNTASCCPDPHAAAAALRVKAPLFYAIDVHVPTDCKVDGQTQSCTQNLIDFVGGDATKVFTQTTASGLLARIQQDMVSHCLPPTTTTLATTTTTLAPVTCQCMDLIIILDTSQSLSAADFLLEKASAIAVVNLLPISPTSVRVALISFSQNVVETSDFTAHPNKDAVIAAIQALAYEPEITNTNAALLQAQAYLAAQRRTNVPVVIQLFVNSKHSDGQTSPTPVATAIRNTYGAEILVIGVGTTLHPLTVLDKAEFIDMAGTVTDTIWTTSSLLISETTNIVAKTRCSATPCPVPQTCKADITFVLETSERVGAFITSVSLPVTATIYTKELQMALTLSQLIVTSDAGNHAALVTFSSPDERTKTQFNLATVNSPSDVQTAIDQLLVGYEQYIGVSDINEGMYKVLTEVFTTTGGDRTDADNFVIFIGEGFYDTAINCCPNPFANVSLVRKKTKDETGFYAVEIGQASVHSNLVQMTGSETRVKQMFNFQDIATDIKTRIGSSCGTQYCACLDLFVVIGSSSSLIGSDTFGKVKADAIAIARQMNVSSTEVRIAFVVFTSAIAVADDLKVNPTVDSFALSLNRVPNEAATTQNPAVAFNRVTEWINTQARVTSKKAVLYYPISAHTAGDDPVAIATQMRVNQQVTFVVAAVPLASGQDTANVAEARAIAGCAAAPAACANVFEPANIDALLPMNTLIFKQIPCGGTACPT